MKLKATIEDGKQAIATGTLTPKGENWKLKVKCINDGWAEHLSLQTSDGNDLGKVHILTIRGMDESYLKRGQKFSAEIRLTELPEGLFRYVPLPDF